VKGTILDESGNPFMGVTVADKGTITDVDGKYTINVKNLEKATFIVFFYRSSDNRREYKGA
jgi:hypothetical protein